MLPNAQTYAALGGDIQDYAPVVDPLTDLPAEVNNETRVDLAAMTRMIGRAVVEFTAGTTPVVTFHDAVWGNTPGVKPTVTRDGSGVYVLTWPASVSDERGVSRGVSLRVGLVSAGEPGWTATCTKTAANAFTVTTWDLMAGSIDDPVDKPFTLMVF